MDDGLSVQRRGPRENGGELVAAEASDHVARTQPGLDQRGNPDEDPVADGMSAAVVDVLEAVEIEHDDGAGTTIAYALLHDPVDLAFQMAPVREVGQRVVRGQVFQFATRSA